MNFTFIGFLLLFAMACQDIQAQSVTNVRFEQVGKQVLIYYDLSGESGSTYDVEVFCSTDGGTTWGQALEKVSGAVGKDIEPGTGKKIIWDVLAEREKLSGEVLFNVTAIYREFSGSNGYFTDTRDGRKYKWVRIGTQVWMAENLNVGEMISGSQNQKNNSIIEKYCYDHKPANCLVYGGLYQWNEMMGYVTTPESQGICPPTGGWHIPSDDEWNTLTTFLGGKSIAGGKMKETGTTHWERPNKGAKNSSGFTALGAGTRDSNGNFSTLAHTATFWSSSQYSATSAYYRNLYYHYVGVYRDFNLMPYGFSVRCLRTD